MYHPYKYNTGADQAHGLWGDCEIVLTERFQPNALKDFQWKSLRKVCSPKTVCLVC